MTRRGLVAAVAPAALVALLAQPPLPPPHRASTVEITGNSSPAYARLLARHVREGTLEGASLRVVDYAAIREDPDYGRALSELARAQPQSMGRNERMAFWTNAYNLLAIRLVVDRYPIASILDVKSGDEDAWEMAARTAGGRVVSLGWIEDMLRNQFRDPRIHFALVAAAVSCPDLRAPPGSMNNSTRGPAPSWLTSTEEPAPCLGASKCRSCCTGSTRTSSPAVWSRSCALTPLPASPHGSSGCAFGTWASSRTIGA